MYTGDMYEEDGIYNLSDRSGNKGGSFKNRRGEKMEYFTGFRGDHSGMAAGEAA